jgi:hypothetical protein
MGLNISKNINVHDISKKIKNYDIVQTLAHDD